MSMSNKHENSICNTTFSIHCLAVFVASNPFIPPPVYNEPNAELPPAGFSIQLRQAAYTWLKSTGVTQPILSGWDDNNNTDTIDTHKYTSNMSEWNQAVFEKPLVGGFVGEGGSRWYQGYLTDNGSPLMVVNWVQALRLYHTNCLRAIRPCTVDGHHVSFVPGVMVGRELMVGNTNTRWHWSTKDGRYDVLLQ